MLYKKLAELYQKLEETPKRLEKTFFIAEFLKKTPSEDLEKVILLLQGRVFPKYDIRKIGVAAKLIIKALHIAYGINTNEIIENWTKTGDLGITASNLCKVKQQVTLVKKELSISDVYNKIIEISTMEGNGAVDRKIKCIATLLTSASPLESKYIIRTILEVLRVGVGEGILRDAIAWSELPPVAGIFSYCRQCKRVVPRQEVCIICKSPIPQKYNEIISLLKKEFSKEDIAADHSTSAKIIIPESESAARALYNKLIGKIQHAIDITNDYGKVIRILRTQDIKGLEKISLQPFIPIKVMLAQKVNSIEDGFEKVGKPAAFEYKYDGFRMQVHKTGGKIKIFTRRLEEVTPQFMDVVEAITSYTNADSFIIDCEAVGISKTGKYLPFQKISQRIKRKYDIKEMAKEIPVEVNVFDIIMYNNNPMFNVPYKKRRELISKIVSEKKGRIVLAKQIITDKREVAENFYKESLNAGNEGVMIKKLNGLYRPGLRVGEWVKLKPVMDSLDLVIIAAEWGEGKRSKWLTSYYTACRDEDGQLYGIGKVSSGLKEIEGETFEQLTEILKPLILRQKNRKVYLKPEVIIEVSYEEIQKSPSYSSGYALRFPRIITIRHDRGVDDIATIDSIKELYKSQRKSS